MKQQTTPVLVHRDFDSLGFGIDVHRSSLKERTLLHWHDHYELEVVLGGSGKYLVNGEEYPLKRGSMYFVTPVDFHQIEGNVSLGNVSFDESVLSGELMTRLIGSDYSLFVQTTEKDFYFIEFLIERLLAEKKSGHDLRYEAERALVELIMIGFLRRAELPEVNDVRSDSVVMRVVAYIKFNFKKKLTLAEAAAEVHLTPNYVGELFFNKMGVTFNQYLMQTRLNYARNLLMRGEVSVQEAAQDAGFGSQTYFSDCFKRAFGYSPSSLIKKKERQ